MLRTDEQYHGLTVPSKTFCCARMKDPQVWDKGPDHRYTTIVGNAQHAMTRTRGDVRRSVPVIVSRNLSLPVTRVGTETLRIARLVSP